MLHVLNSSVDIPDPNGQYISENLAFNDQETIVEIVIEKILGFGNVIAEYDDVDGLEHNKIKVIHLINFMFFQPFTEPAVVFDVSEVNAKGRYYYFKHFSLKHIENFLHPPELV